MTWCPRPCIMLISQSQLLSGNRAATKLCDSLGAPDVVPGCLFGALENPGEPIGTNLGAPAMELGEGEAPHELEVRERNLVLPETTD